MITPSQILRIKNELNANNRKIAILKSFKYYLRHSTIVHYFFNQVMNIDADIIYSHQFLKK